MEKTPPKPLKSRRRLVAEIDPGLIELLQIDRARTGQSVKRILETILNRHYRTKPRIGA